MGTMNHSDNSSSHTDDDSEEDDLGRDPFAFAQHKFKKVRHPANNNSNINNKKSNIDNDSDDDSDDSKDDSDDESDDSSRGSPLFSSRSKRGKKNSLIRPTKKKPRKVGTTNRFSTHANSSDDDDDDDDDDSSTDEKENQTNGTTTTQSVPHALSRKKPMSSLTPVDAILLSSSSDEDDNTPSRQSSMHRTTRVRSTVTTTAAAPSECDTKTMNAIRQAKEAAYALRAAQAAKPTDYYVSQEKASLEIDMEDDDEDDDVLGSETDFTAGNTAAAVSHGTQTESLASLGPTIRLSLRVMISEPNGGNAAGNNAKTVVGKIRMEEPLERIVQDLSSGNISGMPSLTPRDKITLTFDGQSLNLKSTPSTHDMEDEDLVDVLVEKGKGTGAMTNIMPNRPQFGGAATATPTATPIAGNMYRSMNRPVVAAANPPTIAGNMFRSANRPAVAVASLPIVPVTLVQVVTRVNGADATKQQFRLRSCDPLQKVVDGFCLKNHVVPSDCRFEFDGALLSPTSTPAQEDMEGDEIIDVRIIPTKWANRTNSTPVNNSTGQSTSPASSLSRLSMTPSTPTVSRPSSASSNNASQQIITIAVLRNNCNRAEAKCFRLRNTDSLAKLKKGYKKQWEKQGCRSVRFYFKNVRMSDEVSTFSMLGIGDRTELVAIENNRAYNP
eukprot:scaffold114797_cov51-Attheya_sp.AAC.4